MAPRRTRSTSRCASGPSGVRRRALAANAYCSLPCGGCSPLYVLLYEPLARAINCTVEHLLRCNNTFLAAGFVLLRRAPPPPSHYGAMPCRRALPCPLDFAGLGSRVCSCFHTGHALIILPCLLNRHLQRQGAGAGRPRGLGGQRQCGGHPGGRGDEGAANMYCSCCRMTPLCCAAARVWPQLLRGGAG